MSVPKNTSLTQIRIGSDDEIVDAHKLARAIIKFEARDWELHGLLWFRSCLLYVLYRTKDEEDRVASLDDVIAFIRMSSADLETALDAMAGYQHVFAGMPRWRVTLSVREIAGVLKDLSRRDRESVTAFVLNECDPS